MKLSMEFGSFEVRFDRFLMYSGDVRGALEMYSWSSLMENISSSSSSDKQQCQYLLGGVVG